MTERKRGFATPGPMQLMKPAQVKEDDDKNESLVRAETPPDTQLADEARSRLSSLVRKSDPTKDEPVPTTRLTVDIDRRLANKIDHLSIETGASKKDIVEDMLADGVAYVEKERGEELPSHSIRLPRGPRGA